MSESDPKPSLHIDTDWKKQAQEEKRRLAEAEKAKAESSSSAAGATAAAADARPTNGGATTDGGAAPGAAASAASASSRAAGARGAPAREMPPASFATLVQSLVTQALYYLGDLTPRGGEPVLNLDLAKHQIDLLGVLEEKTANNLTPEEKRLLDAALYESRMRYISTASQFLGP